ncbi:hypothetical protein N7528_003919 [Penicillium herquei]|nr:hypothetical protein N7528_003919 [Penicillium herquei]
MVLRKQPPPRLENLHQGNPKTSRSKISPSKTSPQRQQLNRLPSEDSIYSPNLHTSPAFDLMPLEEAQRSPVGSPTTHPPSSWEEGEPRIANTRPNSENYTGGPVMTAQRLPMAIMSGLPQVVEHEFHPPPKQHDERNKTPEEVPAQLQSNNPFLKPTRKPVPTYESSEPPEWNDRHSHATTNSEALSQTDGYIPMTARLSLLDPDEQESPWSEYETSHLEPNRTIPANIPQEQSPWASQHSIKISVPEEIYLQGAQANPYAPAVVVQPSSSADNLYGLQPPYSQGRLGSDTGARSPSAFSSATSATSHELIDLEPSEYLGAEAGSQHAGSSIHSFDGLNEKLETHAPDTQLPPKTPPTSQFADALQPQLVPLPRSPMTPAEEARQKEQRAETYSIRQINWKDRTGKMLQSPILIQNKNGPCPLLALINALVLRADPTVQPPIVKALQTREQISLGLLIEALFEELITRLGPEDSFPDIEALSQFLTILHTGMNVNPRLTLETVDSLGTFLQTPDLQLYSTFGVPLIHGWLASWSSPVHDAMTRVAQFHEDIQLLHFRKQELEERIMRSESLSSDEEHRMADIQTIQYFVDIENKTQLSPFGLTQLSSKLAPGSVSIFFRNDHFSTLYKHPQSHQLFTLVTDAGYANHAEVVWESVVDVTGFNSEFFTGDFRTVSHNASTPAGPTTPAGPRTSSAPSPNNLAPGNTSPGRLSPQEQADADYAYALSLQFQEEEEEQSDRRNSQQGQGAPPPPIQHPIPVRPSNEHPQRLSNSHHRLSINSNPNANVVGLRPARQPHTDPDPDDPNAPPPPYEQAASRPQYRPGERPSQFTEFPSEYSSNQYPGNRYQRNGRYSNSNPGSRPENRYNPNITPRDRDRDCILM